MKNQLNRTTYKLLDMINAFRDPLYQDTDVLRITDFVKETQSELIQVKEEFPDALGN